MCSEQCLFVTDVSKQSLSSSMSFLSLVVIPYRWCGTTYTSHLQGFFLLLVVITYRRFGKPVDHTFKYLFDICGNILPTFRHNISVTYSRVFWLHVVISYRRFGTTCRPHFQGSFWSLIRHWMGTDLPPFPILSQIKSMPPSHFLKLNFNIILLPKPTSSKISPPKPLRNSHLLHACYTSRPSHSSLFYHPKNIWWAVQIIKGAWGSVVVKALRY